MQGQGSNPLAHEATVENSEPYKGYREDIVLTAGDWTLGTGLHLAATGAGVVGIGTVEGGDADFLGIVWDDTADASDTIRTQFQLPGQYNPTEDELVLRVWARKVDTTGSASDNADLTLNCVLSHLDPAGSALVVETAVANDAEAEVAAATATFASWTLMEFAFSGEGLKPNSAVILSLGPNEAVGTDLALQMLMAGQIRIRRHAALATKSERIG